MVVFVDWQRNTNVILDILSIVHPKLSLKLIQYFLEQKIFEKVYDGDGLQEMVSKVHLTRKIGVVFNSLIIGIYTNIKLKM